MRRGARPRLNFIEHPQGGVKKGKAAGRHDRGAVDARLGPDCSKTRCLSADKAQAQSGFDFGNDVGGH
jgi:hypothetical protein